MRDLVAHDGGELFVGRLQFVDQTRVDGHLAVRHAPGVDLVQADHVRFPWPLGGVVAEGRGLRNEAPDDGLDARHLRRVLVERALLLRLRHHLRIGLFGAGVDLFGGHGHALVSLHADGAGLGRIDGFASRGKGRHGGQQNQFAFH